MAAGCQQTNLVGRSARNLLACLAWQWRVGTPLCSSRLGELLQQYSCAFWNNAAPLVPLRLPHNRPRRRRRTWYLRLCMSNCPSFCVAVLQAKATRQEEDLEALQARDYSKVGWHSCITIHGWFLCCCSLSLGGSAAAPPDGWVLGAVQVMDQCTVN